MSPLSVSLIVGPSSLWYIQFYSLSSISMLVFVTLCLLGSLGCLCTAYFTEPGLLPTVDEEMESADSDGKPSRPKKFVVLPGDDKRSDLVDFRAKNCRNTANTVEKFDHFCPWTGNAVGERNYRYYFCFLVFTNMLAMMTGGSTRLGRLRAHGSGGSRCRLQRRRWSRR